VNFGTDLQANKVNGSQCFMAQNMPGSSQ